MAIYGSDQHTSDESCVVSIPYEPVKIKDKWKVFAIEQHFSHDATDVERVALFDALMNWETDGTYNSIRSKENATVWAPFEQMDPHDFVDNVYALALHAQEVESSDD